MMYSDGLLMQEVVYEQFDNVQPDPPPSQVVNDPGGALTGLSSNTLVVGGKVGTVQGIEAPQPLGTGNSPTFATLNCTVLNTTDDATSRTNLGLGGLAIRNAGTAVANDAGTISNPPTQAEVTRIRDKLNELLNSLRTAGIIAT
jgi:hypothetical protein